MKKTNHVSAERLRELLEYDSDTGHFLWLVTRSSNAQRGFRAGCSDNHGYWRINVDGRCYFAHRLVWLYVTGKCPKDQIDHINGNRFDNRFVNLRAANRSQNAANSKRYSNNSSGFKGVSWCRFTKRWCAYITKNNKQHAIGRFDTPEAAHAAYCAAAKTIYGKFARAA